MILFVSQFSKVLIRVLLNMGRGFHVQLAGSLVTGMPGGLSISVDWYLDPSTLTDLAILLAAVKYLSLMVNSEI